MISVIGGGPAGCYAAKLLAEKGKQVKLFEEHSKIGEPVQCTGIVTKSFQKIIPLKKEFLVNKLKRVRVHAPNGSKTDIKINDVVIDRAKLDNYLAKQAEKKGAQILTNRRVENISRDGKKLKIKNIKTKKITTEKTKYLVGADGPNSIVSRWMGNKKPEFWIGMQAVVKMSVEKDMYSVHLGDKFPGFFGWVVPENNTTARVGIAVKKNPRKVFQNFIKTFGKIKIQQIQGGVIPVYNPKTIISSKKALLVGDSAGQVKATTGGGLVPGLNAAEGAVRSILAETDYTKELLDVKKELKMSNIIRIILNKFTDKDYIKLVKICNKKSMQELLSKDDRDNVTKLVFKAVFKAPELAIFSRVLFRTKRVENA